MIKQSKWWNRFTSVTETTAVVRMFLTFLILSAIAFIAIIFMTVLPAATYTLNQALEEANETQAGTVSAELEQYIDDRRLAVIDVASNAFVKSAVLGNTPQSPAFLDYISNTKVLGEPADFYLFNLLGNEFYSARQQQLGLSTEKIKSILSGDLPYHVTFSQAHDEAKMHILVPIQYGNSIEGVLAGVLDASPSTIFQSHGGSSDQSLAFGLIGDDKIRAAPVKPEDVFASNAKLAQYPIEVVLFSPRDVAVQRRNEIVSSVMGSAAVGALIVFAVLFLLGRQLILRPYANLTRTQQVISGALEGIATIGTDGRFTFGNDAFLSITGRTQDNLIGQSWLTIAHPDDLIFRREDKPQERLSAEQARQNIRAKFAEAHAQKRPMSLELQLAMPDLQERYAAFTVVAYDDPKTGVRAGTHVFAKDITDRKRAEQRDRMLSSIVEKSNDAVIICSPAPSHPIIYVNEAFERKFGFSLDEMVGLTIRKILQVRNTPQTVTHEIEDAMKANKALRTQVVNRVKSGEEKIVDANFFPIVDDSGTLQYYAILERDISDEIRLQEERETLIAELQASNSELEEFAYRTSHDLRSPLLSSIGLIKLSRQMLEIGESIAVADSLALVQNSLQKLDALADDILTLTKTKYDDAANEFIDLEPLIHETIGKLAYLENAERMDKRIVVDQPRPFCVETGRLRLVIENLVSNAIKYQDPSEDCPFLKISARLEAGQLNLVIEDNGLGIPQEQHDNMFKMFKRFHPKTSFGSGLGLYMIQKSVNVMNGEIAFEPLEKGARFKVTLPEACVDRKKATI